jgi:riboflavin transporter
MNSSKLMQYVVFWIRWVFGAHVLFSGLNYFFNFFPPPPLTGSAAAPFIDAMTKIGMYDFIKVIEVLTGAALLLDVFVPLALVVEFPVSVSIFFLDVLVDRSPRPTVMGSRELLFNLFLIAAYFGYYRPMLTPRAGLRELWRPTAARLPSAEARNEPV